jgi:hypothetical protein
VPTSPKTQAQVGTAVARVAAKLAGGEALARLLASRLEAVAGEAERERQVLDALLPPVEVLADAATTQLMWNARARAEALAEFGAFTAAQLAELRGVDTSNPHSMVSRWLHEKRVFAVDSGRGRLLPAFQFEDGKPRPIIGRVLAALAGQLRGWELLLWFTASNGHLEARPVDRLASDPEGVVAAAAYQASLSED